MFQLLAIRCGLMAALFADAPVSSTAVPGAVTITNSIGMKLVLVPAGEFMMGAVEDTAASLARFPTAKASWFAGETPRHHVRITREFYMGMYEVTLGQFLTFYHDAHYKIDSERDERPNWGYDARTKLVRSRSFSPWSPGWSINFKHPVPYVSWNDASAFCEWLSKKEGKKYRLPTEAEWEYACRAGTTTLYSNGNTPERLTAIGNVADATAHDYWPNVNLVVVTNSDHKKNMKVPFPFLRSRDGYVNTAPVGRFRPNAFGLYDMHGNVAEWCSDFYSAKYYAESPEDDPTGPAGGTEHVLRGGGWYNTPERMRSSNRSRSPADHRFYMWGFRVVCERPPIHIDTEGLNLTR
ncbi:MAG TPA: formylglycine-generating enzyme family protein [Pirellulales bacterium]|nr:formylglycine-generating enzyme family protein [Pirellulales bacterium]